jgi:putative copper export protein
MAAFTTGTRRIGWPLYSIAALLVCASVPLLGHGAGAPERTVLHGLHVMAGAVWIGTLVMLASLASRRPESEQADVYVMVAAFSRVALPSAAILLATGTIVSVLYVQQLAHLWDTVYGRLLVAKLALVAVVAAGGRRNWQRSRQGMAPSLRVMMTELAAAVLVVAVTGVLTELEHP